MKRERVVYWRCRALDGGGRPIRARTPSEAQKLREEAEAAYGGGAYGDPRRVEMVFHTGDAVEWLSQVLSTQPCDEVLDSADILEEIHFILEGGDE